MALDAWTWQIEDAVRDLLVAQYATVLGGIDPAMTAIVPNYEMQARNDSDVEETQLPQSKNGIWFRCRFQNNIAQINGKCTRAEHKMTFLIWTLADQLIAGEPYPNPISAGARYHQKSVRAVQQIVEDSDTGLIAGKLTHGAYWVEFGAQVPVTAKPGWSQVVMSTVDAVVRQKTISGRGA